MRLLSLDPHFVRYFNDGEHIYHRFVDDISKANGITFDCPKCSQGGTVGSHGIMCWSRTGGVPDLATPGPGRWSLNGTNFEDLSLKGEKRYDGTQSSDSVHLRSCGAHFFITNGAIIHAG